MKLSSAMLKTPARSPKEPPTAARMRGVASRNMAASVTVLNMT